MKPEITTDMSEKDYLETLKQICKEEHIYIYQVCNSGNCKTCKIKTLCEDEQE